MKQMRTDSMVRKLARHMILAAVLFGAAGVGYRVAADDAVTTPKQAIADSLQRVFAGAAPTGLADLKGMQSQIQGLTEQLTKCTVGVEVRNAQGSGVIISKDGYVLTAAHVAGEPNRDVTFFFSDGRKIAGKTLGLCRSIDAGLMKITEPGEHSCAEMALAPVKEGQWCLAMGHPGGYQTERGAVLRLGRVVWLNDRDKTITTNCTLVGGDSGGPLFDLEGHVIGINSRIGERLTANMHVQVSAYKENWDRLEKGEAWGHQLGRKPYLGVGGTQDTPDAKITRVSPGSPAERAGLMVGDVVLQLGSKEITDFNSLVDAVDAQEPPRRRGGRQITLKVRRGDETMELKVPLAFRDE